MIINLSNSQDPFKRKVLWKLESLATKFYQHYNIDENKAGGSAIYDHQIRIHFCQWLTDSGILKVKSWEMTRNAVQGDYVIGTGFDIDDSSLTMFALGLE